MEKESWAVDQVAPPESLRFLNKPMRPLQSHGSQPFPASLDGARYKSERRSHTNGHRHPQARQSFINPAVLPRRPKSYPENIRTGVVDSGDGFLILLHGQRPERWRKRAGDAVSRPGIGE